MRKRQEEDGKQTELTIPDASVTNVARPLSPPSISPEPGPPAAAQTGKAELEKQKVEERVEEEAEERKRNVNEEPRKKPIWLDDDDLPPMM